MANQKTGSGKFVGAGTITNIPATGGGPTFPPGSVVPQFIAGRPNAGEFMKNPVMGIDPPYNGMGPGLAKK